MPVTQSSSFQFASADIEQIEKKENVKRKIENIEIDEPRILKLSGGPSDEQLRLSLLTFFKIVCFSDIDQDEGHQLELGEPLPGGGGDGQQVPELVDLVIDVISPHLARTFGEVLMYL